MVDILDKYKDGSTAPSSASATDSPVIGSGDDIGTTTQCLAHPWEIAEFFKTMERAHANCLSVSEICAELYQIWKAPNSNSLLLSLRERERALTENDAAQLNVAIRHVILQAETLDPKSRDRAHRAVRRVARILPSDLATSIAASFINYRCKPGRDVAVAVFQKHPLPPALVREVLSRFEKTREQHLLVLIARSKDAVIAAPHDFLLRNIEEEYWRARVVEVYLQSDPARAFSVAEQFPREFARAVERSKDASGAEHLISMANRFFTDIEFLNLYARALGRTGHRDALERLFAQVTMFASTGTAPT